VDRWLVSPHLLTRRMGVSTSARRSPVLSTKVLSLIGGF
jgi:hypothetical protein